MKGEREGEEGGERVREGEGEEEGRRNREGGERGKRGSTREGERISIGSKSNTIVSLTCPSHQTQRPTSATPCKSCPEH